MSNINIKNFKNYKTFVLLNFDSLSQINFPEKTINLKDKKSNHKITGNFGKSKLNTMKWQVELSWTLNGLQQKVLSSVTRHWAGEG